MKIGELAQIVNLNVETLRYYERLGLLEQPKRTQSGYRNYEKSIVDQIEFILKAQQLGFTLTEIKTLLQLKTKQKTSQAIDESMKNKLSNLNTRFAELTRFKDYLLTFISF